MDSESKSFLSPEKFRTLSEATAINDLTALIVSIVGVCISVFVSFFFTMTLLLPFAFQRMKEVTVGEQKVLLVHSRGQYSAVGSQCSHYNAPLVKGKTSSPLSLQISICR